MSKTQFARFACFLFLVPFILLPAACGKDKSSTAPGGASTITLSLTNIQPLGNGLNYQAWAVEYYNGYYYGYALGIFNFNTSGQMVSTVGDTVLNGKFTVDLAAADVYGVGLTVENSTTRVSSSSAMKLIGGPFSDGAATLTTDSWMGMGIALTNIAGKYLLLTPTDSINTDEFSGVWFLDNSTGITLNGLTLPEMTSAGWDYEGWVLKDGVYLSMGRFSTVNGADDSNAYGDIYSSPLYPGQDFLKNAPAGITFPTDLRGATVMVTLEPATSLDPDASNPFHYTLLTASIPSGATDHTTYFLTKPGAGIPGGTATVE